MPKVKRFRNSLKSAHTSHEVIENSSSPTSDPAQSNAIGPSTSVQSFPHDALNSMSFDEVHQEQAPTQPSKSSATSRPMPNWRVETIDSQKNIKTIKLKVHDVNNLPLGERIIVDFDEYGAAIGAEDGLLAGYCGTLATDCNLFPISFDKWLGPSGVPQKYKKDCFETILKVTRLEYQLEETLNALKAYMISKEGSIPDEFTSLFTPQPQVSDAEVETTSPVDI